MQRLRRKRFGEILLAEGVIDRSQLHEALEVQKQTGETIGEVLLREGVIGESDVLRCVCTQYQLPLLRPTAYELDKELLSRFSADFLFVNRICPLEDIGGATIVAVGEIPPEEVERELRASLDGEVFFYMAPVFELQEVLKEHFQIGPDDVHAYEDMRRARVRQALGIVDVETPSMTTAPGPEADAGGGNWESIFDEAEQRLGEE